ncbi:MAG: hypothetical protein Q8O89_09020 [Nanoarchaeota archaeon]|nr:hypothetical protein [Nanoarchaeota archaeon]
MKSGKLMFFSVFTSILLLLFIAGCGEKAECKVKSDCSSKKCFTYSCADGKCIPTAIDKCCGNARCEDKSNESFCNCPSDCSEKKNATKNMKYICLKDNPEYALGVSESDAKTSTSSQELNFGGFSAITKFNVNTPFDIDSATFGLEFTLNKLDDGVSKPTITKVELKGSVDREQILLGEAEVNKILWSPLNVVDVNVPVAQFVKDTEEKTVTSLVFNIYYEYYEGTGIYAKKKTGVTKYSLETKSIIFVNPTFTRKCPSCDDKNRCTEDICGENTNYFCEHKPKADCESNGICEEGENKCTAPKDCGYCDGGYGQYIRLACSESQNCLYVVKSEPESITKLESTQFGAGKMTAEVVYDKPFDITKSLISVRIKIDDASEEFSNLEIVEIRVMDDATRLGKISSGDKLTRVGDETNNQEISLDIKSAVPEFKKSFGLEIDYRSTTRSGTKTETSALKTFKIGLDNVEFVKPGEVPS